MLYTKENEEDEGNVFDTVEQYPGGQFQDNNFSDSSQ